MLHRARIPALLFAAALAVAADAPNDAEWAPIAKAIEAGGADAVAKVEAVTTAYPKWPDGFRALASAKLRVGDSSGAWKAARAAIGLNGKDGSAAAIGIQALGNLGRYDDAYKVAEMFTDASDADGAVAAQAAITALQGRNDTRVASFLELARKRSGGAAPILDFVAAKQAQRAKDLPAAVAALGRAIAAKPDYRDALYELGRVLTVQAMQATDQSVGLLAKAEESFQAAAKLDLHDTDSRFGLGRAQLEHGKRLNASGKTDEGGAMLRQAMTAFDDGLQLDPKNRDGKLWKGDALLRLGRFDEAAVLLKQAYAAGAIDHALPFNLALALTRSGKAAEAGKVLENVEAQNDDERLTLAVNAYGQGDWSGAQKMFSEVITSSSDAGKTLTAEDIKQRWSAYRYLGHCARELAAVETKPDDRAALMESAAKYYKEAGDNDDYVARHWYTHVQVQRGPQEAFIAGRQLLKWNGFWNPPAWKLLVANYGWKVSHGEGVGGVLKYGPAHLMLWTLLAIIPVGLFLKGWLLPGGLYGGGKPKTGTRSQAKPGSPAPAGGPAPRKPGTGAAAAAARRPGAKPASRALSPKDGTGPKTPFSG